LVAAVAYGNGFAAFSNGKTKHKRAMFEFNRNKIQYEKADLIFQKMPVNGISAGE
jgi:hypothetical protein